MTDENLVFKFDELEKDGAGWLKQCMTTAAANNINAMDHKCFARACTTKEAISKLLYEGLRVVERQNKLIGNLREQAQTLKSETIHCQATVIRLQEQQIAGQGQQLAAMNTSVADTVKTTVHETVEKERKSYSQAVKSSSSSTVQTESASVFKGDNLKAMVKNVVEKEDRSRNLMMFGLPEKDGGDEQLKEDVVNVFGQIGEKPRIEVCRLGTRKGSHTPRPVRVKVTSSVIVQQILVKAKQLRLSESHKSIFLSPDCSVEERAKQKELVAALKKKKLEEPNKKHFLKHGKICSEEAPHQ